MHHFRMKGILEGKWVLLTHYSCLICDMFWTKKIKIKQNFTFKFVIVKDSKIIKNVRKFFSIRVIFE